MVSTRTTLIPAAIAASIGFCITVLSLAAIRIACGFDATTVSSTGF